MELFLGLSRADRFSGGELISVYQNYLNAGGTALLQQLLLHNEEDVTGLPVLLSLLSYRDFFLGSFSEEEAEEKNDDGRTAFARKKGIFFRVTGTAPSGLKLFRPSYESRERWSDLESLGQAGENALLLLAEECLVSAGLRES